VLLVKNAVIFKEDEVINYVYFVRKGEVQICKRVFVPRPGGDAEDVAKLLEDP